MIETHDVIVIGGGHAGAEAAWAAARMGARTALVTMQIEGIGRMSCNPAIGGIGKGQMVREIDALGGLMGLATDASGIQYRMLNRSKGPAVWSPRAQADRDLYPSNVQALLKSRPNLELIEGIVEDILTVPTATALRVTGLVLQDGRRLTAPNVIVTTGTFMRGLMHCGEQQTAGGRVGEKPSTGISCKLLDLGFELGRLKTGTPPRVDRDSIDFSALEIQAGDEPPVPFSFVVDRITLPQVTCWISHTTPESHELIRRNLHRAPMYSGQIKCRGVRYCPSIEDKVVRFADKARHQIFLEPEGLTSQWVYLNGLGTSMPRDVQAELVHAIAGLERARIVQWGYAVEYDFVPTHQTRYSLESKPVEGLFLAGQINGTSGYEEAAAQGLMAGINAVLRLRAEEPLVLGRDQAYIGVMIDDLIARPPDEPYRMFTSRAEYRLLLRTDNADERLTTIGRNVGLVDDRRWGRYESKMAKIRETESVLATVKREGKSLLDLLRRPEAEWTAVVDPLSNERLSALEPAVLDQVQIRAKYEGYVRRMQQEIMRMKRLESCRIPEAMAFEQIGELRYEAREKFTKVRPMTLGQASRISGITPSDITTLWLSIEAARRSGRAAKST